MKHLAFAAIVSLLAASCSKNDSSASINEINGVWVEQSLRLDTLDFDGLNFLGPSPTGYPVANFKCRPFMDLALNPTYPINNSTIYSYYFKSDSIYLYSHLSSAMIYRNYSLKMNSNKTLFEVERFYKRNSLPATISFVKIN